MYHKVIKQENRIKMHIYDNKGNYYAFIKADYHHNGYRFILSTWTEPNRETLKYLLDNDLAIIYRSHNSLIEDCSLVMLKLTTTALLEVL